MKFLIFLIICGSLLSACNNDALPVYPPGKLGFYKVYSKQVSDYPINSIANYIEKLRLNESRSLSEFESVEVHPMHRAGYFIDSSDVIHYDKLLQKDSLKQLVPGELFWAWSATPEQDLNTGLSKPVLYPLRSNYEKEPFITEKDLEDVRTTISNSGSPAIIIVFNDQGKEKFERLSQESVGEFVAITINDRVITCPMMQSAVALKEIEISGNFSNEEARELAGRIKSSIPTK